MLLTLLLLPFVALLVPGPLEGDLVRVEASACAVGQLAELDDVTQAAGAVVAGTRLVAVYQDLGNVIAYH